MSVKIYSDQSRQVDWFLRRKTDAVVTINVTQNNAPYNLSSSTFIAEVFKTGESTPFITLTQGSGITNGGASGVLTLSLTDTQLNIASDQYFWKLRTTAPTDYLWFNGKFIVNEYIWDAGTTSATVNVSLTVSNTTLELDLIAAAVGGGGSGTVESVTGDGVDNTDPANPVISFPTPAEIGAQSIAVVVSSNQVAVNDGIYVNVASATYTDPTPAEGKGFTVFVRNGTATVGGTAYAVAGTIVRRIFHSGGWANYPVTVSDESYGVSWNGSLEVPTKNAVYDKIESSNWMVGDNNLSEVVNKTTSRSNIDASHDRLTLITKSANFSPVLSDFTGLQPTYYIDATLTLELPSDSVQNIQIGKVFYGITLAGFTTTFIAGSGASIFSSSGTYAATPSGTSDFYFWSCTKVAANTWFIQLGTPPSTSPLSVTFLASSLTFTNMPSGVQELSGGIVGRYRTRVDLSNYTQVRVTVGVSTAGSANAGFYLQYSTDDTSFTDIGTATGSNIANIGSTGTRVSGWVTLPVGAKADVFLRVVSISGDGAADPVCGNITAYFI